MYIAILCMTVEHLLSLIKRPVTLCSLDLPVKGLAADRPDDIHFLTLR